jgi:hypothetical protein
MDRGIKFSFLQPLNIILNSFLIIQVIKKLILEKKI